MYCCVISIFFDIPRTSDCPDTPLKNFADQVIRGRAISSNLRHITFWATINFARTIEFLDSSNELIFWNISKEILQIRLSQAE